MNTMMWRFTEGNAQPEEIDMIWELSKQVNSTSVRIVLWSLFNIQFLKYQTHFYKSLI